MTDKANEVKTEISTRDCYQVSYFIQVCTRVSTVKPTEDEVYEAAGRISSEVTQALHDYLVTCDQWVQLNHGRCITERDYEVIPNSGGIENILAERIVSVDHVRETDSFRFEDLEEEYRGKGFGKLLMRCLPVDTSSDFRMAQPMVYPEGKPFAPLQDDSVDLDLTDLENIPLDLFSDGYQLVPRSPDNQVELSDDDALDRVFPFEP